MPKIHINITSTHSAMARDLRSARRTAYNLVLDTYLLLDHPRDAHVLAVELRRAAVSLPLLLARAEEVRPEMMRRLHLEHAAMRVRELELLCDLAFDLGFIEKDVHTFVKNRLEKILCSLTA